MNTISEDIKKIMLAGIGAVATTAEKSIDALVKKGELTVEQGKILNEELKHDLREKLRTPADTESIRKDLEKVSRDDLAMLKAHIEELEKGMENEQSE
ncbi:MAG: aspartyl beta-hydroxylase [[Clostridium] innocuum]|nr:aspartyl beta-hydroxylase [[Clostridium] innocuum]